MRARNNLRDLPPGIAERLSGVSGSVEEVVATVKLEDLRDYLTENYGDNPEAWKPALERMLNNKSRMTSTELKAVEAMMKELDGGR